MQIHSDLFRRKCPKEQLKVKSLHPIVPNELLSLVLKNQYGIVTFRHSGKVLLKSPACLAKRNFCFISDLWGLLSYLQDTQNRSKTHLLHSMELNLEMKDSSHTVICEITHQHMRAVHFLIILSADYETCPPFFKLKALPAAVF